MTDEPTQHSCILCDAAIPHFRIFCAECDKPRHPVDDTLGLILRAFTQPDEKGDDHAHPV